MCVFSVTPHLCIKQVTVWCGVAIIKRTRWAVPEVTCNRTALQCNDVYKSYTSPRVVSRNNIILLEQYVCCVPIKLPKKNDERYTGVMHTQYMNVRVYEYIILLLVRVFNVSFTCSRSHKYMYAYIQQLKSGVKAVYDSSNVFSPSPQKKTRTALSVFKKKKKENRKYLNK